MKEKIKKLISPFAICSLIIFIIVSILLSLSEGCYAFADLLNGSLPHLFRSLLGSISSLIPISLIEILILALPFIIFFVIKAASRVFSSGEGRIKFLGNIAAVILLIYSGHLLILGVGHNITPISAKMGLESVEVNEQSLKVTLIELRDEINALDEKIERDPQGLFVHGYSQSELGAIISEEYISFADRFDLPRGYYSIPKQVYFSQVMGYLGISGIYTYPTGEANVNRLYPDYVTAFTSAHEMCHQRGIMRENEANFIAYILLYESGDPALQYSAALNMYSYVGNALYKTNPELYREINSGLDPAVRADVLRANEITREFGDTIIEDISDFINDLYLESSGSGGIISYSRVVHLLLAYRDSDR